MRKAFWLSCLMTPFLLAATAVQAAPPDGAKEAEPPRILPHFFTDEEKKINLEAVQKGRAPVSGTPSGVMHCPAEYEPMQGMLIRWWVSPFNSLVTSVVTGLTQSASGSKAYVLVTGTSERTAATSAFTSAGANMDRVQFITYTSNSGWIRDYGPIFLFQDNTRAIIDAVYGASRPLDDAFPDALSNLWYEPSYDFPLHHAGGNFLPTSYGDAHVSRLILDDHPSYSQAEIEQLFADYYGVNLRIHGRLPSTIDGTGHIDMWMMVLSDDKVIISEFTHSNPSYPGITVTEEGVLDMTARGFTVYRVPAHNGGTNGYNGTHFTYTNAIICNDTIFISRFGGTHAANDAAALAVWQAAMPGYTIIQIDSAAIIPYAGAMHCLSMHVPKYEYAAPSAKVLSPNGGEVLSVGDLAEIEWAASDDVAVTNVDLYYSTDNGATYPHLIASGTTHDGRHMWSVPNTPSNTCRVKVIAHDASANTGEGISAESFIITDDVPQVVYSWSLDANPGWSTEGQWAWGTPTGGGGDHGGPDPTSGQTGTNVYGYNLSGDYPADLTETHLTTTAIDCSCLSGTTLRFWRWLGVEQPLYDHAYIRASNNGSDWTTIWTNTTTVSDTSWTQVEYDISAVADGEATVYLRWTMGETDYTWQYCGWNIDDIEIEAFLNTPLCDVDGDCDVDANDAAALCDVLLGLDMTNEDRADINGDEVLDGRDIQAFVEQM